MNQHLATLLIAAACLGLCAPATSQTAEAVVCAPEKKKPPVPGPRPQTSAPGLNAVCAPVISIGAPLAGPGAISDIPKPVPPADIPNTLKFKIKNVLEAELTSKSQYLTWALLGIFVVFAALILFIVKTAASEPNKSKWITAAIGVVLAACATYYLIHRLVAQTVPTATVDKVSETVVSTAKQSPASADAMQWQFLAWQAELREQRQQAAAQLARPSDPFVLQSILLAALLLAMGTMLGLVGSRSRTQRPRSFRSRPESMPTANAPDDAALPVDDIYWLEELVAQLRAVSGRLLRRNAGERPQVDINELLLAMNQLRRHLEGAKHAARPPSTAAPRYRLRDDADAIAAHELDSTLSKLEKVLASRYELSQHQWRTEAIKALAAARRSLVAICEPQRFEL